MNIEKRKKFPVGILNLNSSLKVHSCYARKYEKLKGELSRDSHANPYSTLNTHTYIYVYPLFKNGYIHKRYNLRVFIRDFFPESFFFFLADRIYKETY